MTQTQLAKRGLLAIVFVLAIGWTAVLSGCDPTPENSDKTVAEQQEKVATEGAAAVGFPGIIHFTEKRVLRQLYEKRDQEHLLTYSYVTDMNGRLHHVCDSIGYGFPYGTQYSNPEKEIWAGAGSGHWLKLPQSEPNGLFVPPTAEGTWVQCIGPGGKIEPMYVEPRVMVSPWPLTSVDSYQLK